MYNELVIIANTSSGQFETLQRCLDLFHNNDWHAVHYLLRTHLWGGINTSALL